MRHTVRSTEMRTIRLMMEHSVPMQVESWALMLGTVCVLLLLAFA